MSDPDSAADVTELVLGGTLCAEDLRLYAYLGNEAARAAVGPDVDVERWTPLLDFVRTWYRDPLSLPEDRDGLRERLAIGEQRLGRPLPESLREWFLLTGERAGSVVIDFPSLPGAVPGNFGGSVATPFGFSPHSVGMLGEEAHATHFEVVSGADHWSWAIARADEDPDPKVIYSGQGGPDADDFPGRLSALLTYAVVKATLDLTSFELGQPLDPNGCMGPLGAGVELAGEEPGEWFARYDISRLYCVVKPITLSGGDRLLSDAEGDTLILGWDDGEMRGAITKTQEARARLKAALEEARAGQQVMARAEAARRQETREVARNARAIRLAAEFAEVDGRSDAELFAAMVALEPKLRRYEKAILVDMRMAFNSGALSGAQRLRAVKLLAEPR